MDGGSRVAVRDSKSPDNVVVFPGSAWSDFLDGIVGGDFDGLTAPRR